MKNGTILKIDTLKKSFFNAKNQDDSLSVLSGLSLDLTKGKVTALIGGNGSGKTTLFNMISGFLRPDSGSILYFSNGSWININKTMPHEISRAGIGRMFQDNHIFRNMTVLENMLIADLNTFGEIPYQPFIFFNKNRDIEEGRKQKALDIFDHLFGDKNPFTLSKDNPAHTLSYGQQRLLGLARLLMGDYRFLLLDEPTSGVSPVFISKIKEIIKILSSEKEMTVFLIEHNWRFVLDAAEFCYFISKGNIELSGTPEDIIGNPEVRKTYLGV
jgi:ABC-type branched-subunit amino acid transport system ATPase component